MENTAFYASLLSILLVVLGVRIIKLRRKLKVSTGNGGNDSLQLAIRTHANFIEYTPIALILLACIEFNGFAPVWCVHMVGLLLLVGRFAHAYGLSNNVMKFRVKGMQLTFASIVFASAINVVGVVRDWVS